MSKLFETLADIEHQRWSDWMQYQFAVCERNEDGSLVIPAKMVKHWTRQIQTDYADLTPAEKASDKEQVHRYWSLVEILLAAKDKQLAKANARVTELEKVIITNMWHYETPDSISMPKGWKGNKWCNFCGGENDHLEFCAVEEALQKDQPEEATDDG